MATPHRFVVFSDRNLKLIGVDNRPIEDKYLATKSCFCRLRMFDPAWQKRNGFDGPILSLDLDLVITAKLDPLLVTESSFKILQGVNKINPCPYNASVMLLKPGHHGEVWDDFSLENAGTMQYHEFPDDQGWIWHKLPNADGWKPGDESGIYGFQKPGWPLGEMGTTLPPNARIVSFIGKRKPGMYAGVPWIRKYWSEVA